MTKTVIFRVCVCAKVFIVLNACGSGWKSSGFDYWEFKHITEIYYKDYDRQSIEFCEMKLTEEELDTLERVLSVGHTAYKRESDRILVLKSHIIDIEAMWAVDGELRSRVESESCPQYVEY